MELSRKTVIGDKNEVNNAKWKDQVIIFTLIPAWVLMYIASFILMIVDQLLLDTHHIEVTCKPKK
mgnify:CR=1 FL=1